MNKFESEIIVEFDGMRLNYSARAVHSEVEFNKGDMVRVVSTGGSVLYVENLSSRQPDSSSLSSVGKQKREEVSDIEAMVEEAPDSGEESSYDEESTEDSETSGRKKGSTKNKKK
ncbi:MAG: hypothetical protein K2Z81_26040 [Cyanobacteria bacterium]|nr:hypothetical protein [Cyanobacteriota bacterium]